MKLVKDEVRRIANFSYQFRIFEEDGHFYVDVCEPGRLKTGIALHPWHEPFVALFRAEEAIETFCTDPVKFVMVG